MKKHTPEPWKIANDLIIAPEAYSGDEDRDAYEYSQFGGLKVAEVPNEGDRHLIEVAPNMYNLLVKLAGNIKYFANQSHGLPGSIETLGNEAFELLCQVNGQSIEDLKDRCTGPEGGDELRLEKRFFPEIHSTIVYEGTDVEETFTLFGKGHDTPEAAYAEGCSLHETKRNHLDTDGWTSYTFFGRVSAMLVGPNP